MRPPRVSVIVSILALSTATVQAQEPGITATPVTVDAKITSVTVYRGRALVTRTATLTLNPGLYDVQIGNLPETIQPASLQARASGDVKVLGVDYSQVAASGSGNQALADLDSKIEDLQRQLKEIAEQRELIKSQEEFIASITVKATAQASQQAGTDKLDLEALRNELTFVAEERAKLLTSKRELDAKQRDLEKQLQVLQANRNALAGASNISRTATIAVVAPESASTTIELAYLVANATWQPTYNVRAAKDQSQVGIEYEAVLTQRTGEDWDNVDFSLSTAQPTVAANPPAIQPWYVDIQQAIVEHDRESGRRYADAEIRKAPAAPAPAPERRAVDKAELEELAADAGIDGGGPSVTFHLPRAITVKTNQQKQQRTRIATIDSEPRFIYVAVPLLTDAVYLRGDLVNASSYQLLPGPVSIFFGQDYIGPTTMPSVAPNGEFKVHFGIDSAIKAARQLVSKRTENTGLLSGGRRTSYEYRIFIDNGCGKPIRVELWDRYPVSRNEGIQIELVDVSAPLSNDAYYVSEEKPQGLLKWILNVPTSGGGAGSKQAYSVSYGVHINRAKDVETSALPD